MANTRTIKLVRAAFPECSVTHGWHLAGAGPARYGIAARHPSGKVRFLGRTWRDAACAVLDELNARLAVAA